MNHGINEIPMKKITQCSALLICLALPVLMSGCGPANEQSQDQDGVDQQLVNETASHRHGSDGSHSHAEGEEGHHEGVPGPNGGRLIADVEPHLEFYMQPDRHARLTFVNDDIEPIPPVALDISLTGGDRTNPLQVGFTKEEAYLLSDVALPDDPDLAVVLQISGGDNAEPVFARFHLNMATCPDCQLHEYACICGHSEHAHDH